MLLGNFANQKTGKFALLLSGYKSNPDIKKHCSVAKGAFLVDVGTLVMLTEPFLQRPCLHLSLLNLAAVDSVNQVRARVSVSKQKLRDGTGRPLAPRLLL